LTRAIHAENALKTMKEGVRLLSWQMKQVDLSWTSEKVVQDDDTVSTSEGSIQSDSEGSLTPHGRADAALSISSDIPLIGLE
jgi:hypothetical protein